MENTMTNDEVMKELIKLLKTNNMQREANDTFEICTYIDSLQQKLTEMKEELSNVQIQLTEMQNNTFANKLKAQLTKSGTKISSAYMTIKTDLFVVRESIKSKAGEIVSEFKKKGKAALNRVYEIFNVKEKLVAMREHVKESQEEVTHSLDKIDAFSAGMSEASHIFKNTFREAFGKQAKDYSQIEKKLKAADVFIKPWEAKAKVLTGMEKRLDGAIDKVTGINHDVELNKMIKLYDRLESKIASDRETQTSVQAVVAEPGQEYGADAFEKYMTENPNVVAQSKEKADRWAGKVSEISEKERR